MAATVPQSDVPEILLKFTVAFSTAAEKQRVNKRRDELFTSIIQVLVQAGAFVTRRMIIKLLQGPRYFAELRDIRVQIGEKEYQHHLSDPTVSKHLDYLVSNGLVERKRIASFPPRTQYKLLDNESVKLFVQFLSSQDEGFFLNLAKLVCDIDLSEAVESLRTKKSSMMEHWDLIEPFLRDVPGDGVQRIIEYLLDKETFQASIKSSINETIARAHKLLLGELSVHEHNLQVTRLENIRNGVMSVSAIVSSLSVPLDYLVIISWLCKEVYAMAGLDIAELERYYETLLEQKQSTESLVSHEAKPELSGSRDSDR